MNQRRAGSDPCEHFFAKTRQNNPCPTLQQCREITSKISGLKITSSSMFSLDSRSNTGGAMREAAEYMEPVPSKKRSKKK